MDNLFIRKDVLGFEKLASMRLEEDTDKWEDQVLRYFTDQFPDVDIKFLEIDLSNIDEDNGAGVGQIKLGENVVVPLVIEKRKLAPLDLFWFDGKLRPLTQDSLMRSLQVTDIGTVIEDKNFGGMGGPELQTYSGGEEMKSSLASVLQYSPKEVEKSASVLGTDGLKWGLINNPKFASVVNSYLSGPTPVMIKEAASIKKIARMAPEKKGRPVLNGPCELYRGVSKVAGFVPNFVIDMNGEVLNQHMFLSFDKTAYVRSTDPIHATPLKETPEVLDNYSGIAKIGCFVTERDGYVIATEPVMMNRLVKEGHEKVAAVTDFVGRQWRVHNSPVIKNHYSQGSDVFMTPDWVFWPCGEEIKVASGDPVEGPSSVIKIIVNDGFVSSPDIEDLRHPESIEKAASVLSTMFEANSLKAPLEHAVVYGSVDIYYDMEVKKTAGVDYNKLYSDSNLRPINLWKESVEVKLPDNLRGEDTPAALIKEASLAKGEAGGIRIGLFKYAQSISEEEVEDTLDVTLGLNFLTEENIGRYIDSVDVIEDARDVVSSLLLASRLGLDLDASPLRTSMFALDSVIKGLNQLRLGMTIPEMSQQ